jgi:hypothetical protein
MKTIGKLPMGLFVVALCGLSAPAFSADQLNADQENLVALSAGWSAVYLAPIGQEFVSDRSKLDAVEVFASNTDMSSPLPADVAINIREASISGQVLGTSLPVSLSFPSSGVVQFQFQSSVRVVPGRVYVIEIVVSPGGGNVAVSGGWTGNYSRGRLILQGEPIPMSDNSDLWFREGTLRRATSQSSGK